MGSPPAAGGRGPPAKGWPPPKTSLSIQKVFDCKRYLYCFVAQIFFLGGTSPHRPRPVRRGAQNVPLPIRLVLHPPTPYTLSPLLKGGEGRGEGGSYTHVPYPFGALLVTLYQFSAKGF
jgi:hypothetical protein